VQWTRDALLGLLNQEQLTADDITMDSGPELTRLIRDLLLVGLADEFDAGTRFCESRSRGPDERQQSPLTHLARGLLTRRQNRITTAAQFSH
jgi:hypothetical protein